MWPFYLTRKTLVCLLSLVYFQSVDAQGQASQPDAAQTQFQTTTGAATSKPPADTGVTPKTETGKDSAKAVAGGLGYGGHDAPKQDAASASPEVASKAPDPRPREDWDSLAIPGNIEIADPAPPLRGDFPEFTREFVQLGWRPLDVIDVYVMKPTGVEKPPVILCLYSYPSDTNRFKVNEFARIATKNGFAAVGFVSALTGQRFHDRPMKEWFVSELQESLGSSVHDVQLLLNYLAKRGDLDMTRVGMFADGSGASIAIMAAAVDPRIKTLDLVDAWGDWPDWLAESTIVPGDERANYLKPEFLKKVENLDPVKWLPQLKTQQVRLQYLQSDTVTPKAARERMEAAASPNAKIVHYDNGKAFLKAVGYNGKMFDWVKEQLVPTVSDQKAAGGNPVPTSPATKASNQ